LPTVLVVDDDAAIERMIRLQLRLDGFEVVSAESGHDALLAFEANEPDVVVLDVMLPGMSGLEVLTWIRSRSSVPILLLTGMSDNQHKVEGLDLGADDYITKPFSPEELGARVRAVLRTIQRTESKEIRALRSGDVTIDFSSRLVLRHGMSVSLSRTEWDLLFYLAERAGKVVLSNEILGAVWGEGYASDSGMLRVFISRIRTKLDSEDSEQSVIRTYPGVGYSLIAEETNAAFENFAVPPESSQL
jgi:DNA-binding response OmpR family regulator